MVLPSIEGGQEERVLVERGEGRRIVHWRDPDTGRFISKSEALTRVRYDTDKGRIIDSFGNVVGVGAFRLPVSGASRETEKTVQVWERSEGDIRRITPGANQEIVERVTVVDRDGKLHTIDISYGLGNKYDRKAQGGKWRYETSKALGYPDNKRVPSSELRGAVAMREFVIKSISHK